MLAIGEQIAQVAPTHATVLVRGESGTGKELVAQAIHERSPRASEPFIKLSCAALPETLIESELFGHERGAFTGAHARKQGRVELAQGGTLLLDELGELSLVTQAKLLRFLQFRSFERLGGLETLHADVRIVTATNRNLEQAVAAGSFREDLYYRVNIFTITVPPLRERQQDVPELARHFLAHYSARHAKRVERLSDEVLDRLSRYAWPGNVRELENAIERAVVVARGRVVGEADLPETVLAAARAAEARPSAAAGRQTLAEAVAELERGMLERALREVAGNCARAARLLGTTERVVRYKVSKLGIDVGTLRG